MIAAFVIGAVVAALVCAPLAGHGWLLLLDWIPGPNPDAPRGLWGLDGGLTSSPLLHLGTAVLSLLVGKETASWLWLALIFPTCFVSMAWFVPGRSVAKLSAGALYALNPFVADRVWVGHLSFLAGYALLPMLVRSLLIAKDEVGVKKLRPALWIAFIAGFSPHFLWIGALFLFVVAVFPRPRVRPLAWMGFVGLALAALSLYLLWSTGNTTSGFDVSNADVAAYQTRSSTPLGVFGTVALLEGFWRLDPTQPVVSFGLLFGSGLVIAALGAVGARFVHRNHRASGLLVILLVTGVASYFLALGTRGFTGGAYSWMFDHVPGFAIMREPQKFAAGLTFIYAVLFGLGIESVIDRLKQIWQRSFMVTLAIALPLLFGSNMVLAFGGSLSTSEYPNSWSQAQTAMGEGQGGILVLPWHLYASQPFVHGRIIAGPSESFFERPVIQGDNVELPNIETSSRVARSAYIESLLERGPSIRSFGQLLAPLGVEYVTLNKNVDFANYSWVSAQSDLEIVMDSNELLLLRNRSYTGVGYPVAQEIHISSVDELIDKANREDLAYSAFVTTQGATFDRRNALESAQKIKQTSPIGYSIPASPGTPFALREPFDQGWTDVVEPNPLITGTTITTPDGVDGVHFGPWGRLKTMYALSVVTALALVIAGNAHLVTRWSPRRKVA